MTGICRIRAWNSIGMPGCYAYRTPVQIESQTKLLSDRRFARIVLVLMALGFLSVLVAGISAALTMARNQDQTFWVSHTYQVEHEVIAIRLSLEEMRSARRGQMLGIDPHFGMTYDEAASSLFTEIARVGNLTRDNPGQQRNVAELASRGHQLDDLIKASMRFGFSRTAQTELQRLQASAAVQHIAERMLGEERQLLVLRDKAQKSSVRVFYAILAVALAILVLVASGSIWVIRRYTRDLTSSRDALQRLNENLEGAVQERTVNLQRANEEIQRFAYIVSHDLRSPLVNVMGFTAELDASIKPLAALIAKVDENIPDLVSHDAREAVLHDLPEAIGFIRTSTQKMDRLINAILRLSREGRRAITPVRIELGELAQSVVDALRHRIDELGVQVTIAPGIPAIVCDRLAVEQILSNLVENAVKYLQPDRPGVIEIGGRSQYGRAMITVADNGRGVEPRDHDRIFDLFRRSGVQDQPGEGIGLAHVRALAYRLGGVISVESELGKGTTFTIDLPVMFAGEKGPAS